MLNYNDQEIAMTLLDIGNGKDKKKTGQFRDIKIQVHDQNAKHETVTVYINIMTK